MYLQSELRKAAGNFTGHLNDNKMNFGGKMFYKHFSFIIVSKYKKFIPHLFKVTVS